MNNPNSKTELQEELSFVFSKYNIKSVLDVPCKNFDLMNKAGLDGIKYMGGHEDESIVDAHRRTHPSSDFFNLNIVESQLPKADLVFCRDLFGHLTNENTIKALNNILNSGSKYLLSTTLTRWDFNEAPTDDGGWYCINLLIKPFYLRPIYLINEDCQEGYPYYNDKCLVLFDVSKMFLDRLQEKVEILPPQAPAQLQAPARPQAPAPQPSTVTRAGPEQSPLSDVPESLKTHVASLESPLS